jgi:hypothetical protein
MTERAPRIFISYSHDDQEHKDWVLALATRLAANGVDVTLDRWDLTLGGDLPRFMESGLTKADRVLAICTSAYVAKANRGQGGVGYEKMILTAQLMKDVTADRIIPVVRRNDAEQVLPTFLGSRVYIDFRDPSRHEAKYAELVRDIHGEKIAPRPPLGENPFKAVQALPPPKLSDRSERYVSPALSGRVAFDYSNNNGRYAIGAGEMAFETAWSGASNSSIHAYTGPPSIRSVALAVGAKSLADIEDASGYDTSSRVRTPHLGEIVVWQNTAGYYAAVRVETVKSRSHGNPSDEVTFSYVIQPNRTACFRSIDFPAVQPIQDSVGPQVAVPQPASGRRYASLQERFLPWGVPVAAGLQRDDVLDLLEAKFVMDDVIVDTGFAGFRGVPSGQLSVAPASRGCPGLPDYVYEARRGIPMPQENRPKAFLEDLSAPIIDQGGRAVLRVGHLDSAAPGGKYDYWTTLAVLASLPRLRQQILSGEIRLRSLGRRMDVLLVVVTADCKVLLARRSKHVDNAKEQWMVSVGESVDGDKDLGQGQAPDPVKTALRCLGENDELNLPRPDVDSAQIQVLGVATEWDWLYANLIMLVRLGVEFGRLEEVFSEGEHTHLEGLEFTVERCLPLVQSGTYAPRALSRRAPLVPSSRVALLMSLMSCYGYDEVAGRIG